MKRIFIGFLLIIAMLSAVACGETESSEGDNLSDNATVGDITSDNEDDSSQSAGEETDDAQSEEFENTEEPAESDSEESVSSEESTETEPEEDITEEELSEDVYTDRIDFTKLSSFGLPEPPFEYTYYYYEETFSSRDDNGEPILSPKFAYDFDCDLETVYNYMKTVQASGWGDYVPESIPSLLPGDSFWYSSEKDGISFRITWDTEGEHYLWVIDKKRTCSWDNALSVYVIDDFGEFGTYGHYMMPVQD